MDFYDVEVDCMAYCYGGSPKFTVEPYGYGEWAKREDVDVLIAERDRLAAENAELRAKLDPDALTICYMSGQATGDAEARAMAKRLRAANATLDALRDRLPEYDTSPEDWEHGDLVRCVADFHAILYPQPAARAKTDHWLSGAPFTAEDAHHGLTGE